MGPTVKLEIYWPWTRRDLHLYSLEVDPIDQESYDEIQAFPCLKPDADAVLYPCWRTRRQRGWYQIIRRRDIAESTKKVDEFRATAGDIPVELLPIIASDIDTSTVAWADRAVRKLARRRVGGYASVCKAWAEILHPPLFHNSLLTSREAVLQLLPLLRSKAGQGRLRRLINRFELMYNPSDVPWLHLMPSVYPLLAKIPIVDLYISGPFAKPCVASFHHQLPRSHPEFSSTISDVTIRNVHFRCFNDLVRLYCSLPHLMFFRGEDLAWDDNPLPLKPPRRILAANLRFVALKQCPRHWPAMYLSFLMTLRPSDDQCILFCALAQLFEGEVNQFGSSYCSPPAFERNSSDFSTSRV